MRQSQEMLSFTVCGVSQLSSSLAKRHMNFSILQRLGDGCHHTLLGTWKNGSPCKDHSPLGVDKASRASDPEAGVYSSIFLCLVFLFSVFKKIPNQTKVQNPMQHIQ